MASFKDLLLKLANNARLTPQELDELGRFGTATEQRNSFVAGNTTAQNTLSVPMPFFPIYSEKLTVDTASITINIPENYNHLFFIGGGRTTHTGSTGDLMTVQFNGDNGSNYRHTGDGVLNGAQTEYQNLNYTAIIVGNWASADADANSSGNFFCFLPHIGSSFWKSSLSLRGLHGTAATGMGSIFDYGMWENTSRISTVKIFSDNSANILAGSRFTVFGMI